MKTAKPIFLSMTVLTLAACNAALDEKKQELSVKNGQLPSSIIDSKLLHGKSEYRESDVSEENERLVLNEDVTSIKEIKDVVTIKKNRVRLEESLKRQNNVKPHIASQKAKLAFNNAKPSTMLYTPTESANTEKYDVIKDNGIHLVSKDPVSTFSIDVDTGSYSNIRRIINDGYLPQKNAVRVEELINYFNYEEEQGSDDTPFSVVSEVGPTPWSQSTHLIRVSLKAAPLTLSQMTKNNLVFLVDVSGSMQSPNKLELLKKSLKLLSQQLDAEDKVSIVVYAGASGVVLEPVAGDNWIKIEQALAKLNAGGSTNGASGIKLAYQMAQQAFIKGGNNRVILATDGDFNVGMVNHQALIDLIEKQKNSGIYLTTLGFGKGNYNDHLMEQLADHGNGNYAYIDNLMEAKKVLVDEIGATLQTVAKDVKIQIEFNPQKVSEYRLIGYENRHLNREDFNNDKVDAGEIGAGHSVMALYEVSFNTDVGSMDPLRYQVNAEVIDQSRQLDMNQELAFVKLRYKPIGSDSSILKTFPIYENEVKTQLTMTTNNYRFAGAVAAFGQKLRGAQYINNFDFKDIIQLAEGSRGRDKQGLRGNFLQLVSLADSLQLNSVKQNDLYSHDNL